MLIYIIRALFVVVFSAVLLVSINTGVDTGIINDPKLLTGFITAAGIAILVVAVDWLTPKKYLSSLAGVFFGLLVGMLMSWAANAVIEGINDAYQMGMTPHTLSMTKWLSGICICYLTISIVIRTKDDIRFMIPYIEFSRQTKGLRPLVLDSSVIVDGRIADLTQTNIFDAPFVVPRFILNELQLLSDSADKLKRTRGRRGLDMLATMQNDPMIEVKIDDTPPPGIDLKAPVDQKLVAFTKCVDGRLVTTDYNLGKVAMLRELDVVNINDIAKALKPVVLPGEHLDVKIIKGGEEPTQGVGYLEDGTMVVVEEAKGQIGNNVRVIITSSLQTSAGRMIFGKYVSSLNNKDQSSGKKRRMAGGKIR